MAREAARLLEGTNWLPEPLRNADATPEATNPEPDIAGDLPAFLAKEGDATEPVVEAAE